MQHPVKVLPWDRNIDQLRSRSAATIARLREAGQSIRQIAADLDRAPSTVCSRAEAQQRQQGRLQAGLCPGAGPRPALDRLAPGARRRAARGRPRPACSAAGRPSRSPAGCASERRPHRSATRASTASSTPRSAAPTTAAWRHYLPARQAQARLAPQAAALLRRPHQAPCFHRLAPAEAVGPPHLRPLGSRPHALRHPRPGRPRRARTQVPRSSSSQAANPARPNPPQTSSTPGSPSPRSLRRSITFDNGTEFAQHHLLTDQLGIRDLLLRPAQPLAEGRRRKRHRPPATILAPQDQPRHPHPTRPRQPHRALQQHPPKMPRLQNTRRSLLRPTVALQT